MMASTQQEERASGMEARVGFVNASPLVQVSPGGTREKMGQLGAAKDEEMIREKLRKSGLRIRFRAVVATLPRVGELLNDGCQIIHYVGHGDGKCLSFESDDDRQCGIMEPLKVNALRVLFRSNHASTKLVIVSSCCSESSGNAFVEAGVPHVIAVKAKESVADEVAHKFGQMFYGALLGPQRHTVQYAFDRASDLASITLDNGSSGLEGGPFVLLPHGGNHDIRIFDQVPGGDFIEETPPLPEVHPRLPRAREPYLGIETLPEVLKPLLNTGVACVTVVGEHGSGKTQRVIQACKYVRLRRKFDAMYFADLGAIVQRSDGDSSSRGRRPVQDLCSLIGRALEMEPAPSSVEQLADFLFKQDQGDLPPRTVLLVLDGVDALVEERDWDARDRFFEFASSLCSRKDSYKLKLLVASKFRLEPGSRPGFKIGRETVLNVEPLKGTDPAQLFFNAVARPLTRRELGVAPGCPHAELLDALEGPLKEAKGHPETLVCLASNLCDKDLNSPSFAADAASLWKSLHRPSTPPTLTEISSGYRRSSSDGARYCDGSNRGSEGGGAGQYPLPNGGRVRRVSTLDPGGRQHHWHDPMWRPHHDRQHVRGTASAADLNDRGCFAVWVEAVANGNAGDRRYGSGDRPMAGGATCGWTDCVPLKSLCDGLQNLLFDQRMPEVIRCRSGDHHLYECPAGRRVDFGECGNYDAINALTPRSISEQKMQFVKERLRREQEIVASGGVGTRARGLRTDRDGDDQRAISIEAFVRFSEWWARVMATLSRLRNDWSWTDPVRVHWFLGKQAASEMLLTKEEGTFLLRLSESIEGALVICVTERVPSTEATTSSARAPRHLCVNNYLVEVDEEGRCHTVYERQRKRSYTSLSNLVLNCTTMQTLYPDTPKEEAFQEMFPYSTLDD